MTLKAFRNQVHRFYRQAGLSRNDLAKTLGLHPDVFSHKLNGSTNYNLSLAEIKILVKTLAGAKAITNRNQVEALLGLLDLKSSLFSPQEWESQPLNELETGILPDTIENEKHFIELPARSPDPHLSIWLNNNSVSTSTNKYSSSEEIRAGQTSGSKLPLDSLTGVYSRLALQIQLPLAFEQARAGEMPLSLCLLDIDHFKSINDAFGHQTGDQVLSHLASSLKTLLRKADKIFRYGGDEFIILLPDTTKEQAGLTLNRLSTSVDNQPLVLHDGQKLSLSLSLGMANFPQDVSSLEELFEKADQRLLQAKRTGRGKLVAEDIISTANPVSTIPETAEEATANSLPLPPNNNNLPAHLCRLIGREKEVKELSCLLILERLLTVIGPGGIGKTRLVQEVGKTVLTEFKDGVYFISLAGLEDEKLVTGTIAGILGCHEKPGQSLLTNLKDYLKEKHLLLLLDNFEHLIAAAPVVLELLKDNTNLHILITSREPLHLQGEQIYMLSPLQTPSMQLLKQPMSETVMEEITRAEAVILFLERSRQIKLGISLPKESIKAIGEICCYLEGLPLAMELAAARIKVFTPVQILEQLRSSGGRLKLLKGGPRDLPERQRKLESTLEWSYRLLTREEKELFECLAIFADSFSLEGSRVIAGKSQFENLEGLSSLVDKSLLVIHGQENLEPRFRMLAVIREFALVQLDNNPLAGEVWERYFKYYLALSQKAAIELEGPEQVKWLGWLENEYSNLRVALGWSIECNLYEKAAELASALGRYWLKTCHYSEGCSFLEQIVREIKTGNYPIAPSLKAKLLLNFGGLMLGQGLYAYSKELLEESLALFQQENNHTGIMMVLNNLALTIYYQGDLIQARHLFEELRTLAVETGNHACLLNSIVNIACTYQDEGNYTAARQLYLQNLELCRQTKDIHKQAHILYNLSLVLFYEGDYPAANAYIAEALKLNRKLGNKALFSSLYTIQARLAYKQGNLLEAASLFKESLLLRKETEDRRGIVWSLIGIANVLYKQGYEEPAVLIYEAAENLRQQVGFNIPPADQPFFMEHQFRLKGKEPDALEQTGSASANNNLEKGSYLTLTEAVKRALAFELPPPPR